jgi:hypothetical protein
MKGSGYFYCVPIRVPSPRASQIEKRKSLYTEQSWYARGQEEI